MVGEEQREECGCGVINKRHCGPVSKLLDREENWLDVEHLVRKAFRRVGNRTLRSFEQEPAQDGCFDLLERSIIKLGKDGLEQPADVGVLLGKVLSRQDLQQELLGTLCGEADAETLGEDCAVGNESFFAAARNLSSGQDLTQKNFLVKLLEEALEEADVPKRCLTAVVEGDRL